MIKCIFLHDRFNKRSRYGPQFCYVMEFKLDGTAEEALAQIADKHYTLPFDTTGRSIVRIGMNFDSKTRNIEKWIIA